MKLRIARATNDIIGITKMYCDGLGFEVLASFKEHAGFDGVMLGNKGSAYHLEFTQEKNVKAPLSHSAESLMVFYIPDSSKFSAVENNMKDAGFKKVKSHNPYWDDYGCTYEDLEGYRVVLSRNDWNL